MANDLPYEQRVTLTRSVLQVLDGWALSPNDQCALLGVGQPGAVRRLRRHRLGNPLPDEPEVWVRVALILDIDRAVNQLFPHSGAAADLWVTTPRVKFGRRTPLELMLSGGVEGIRRVARSLDNLDLL
jgi:uncharacterized protein (DUF2384 family)